MREEKQTILYLMHIDWQWIKQRQHFLSIELSKYFDVVVGFLKCYRFRNLQKQEFSKNIKYVALLKMPNLFIRNRFLLSLWYLIIRIQIKHLLERKKYSFIWLTSPNFYPAIPQEKKDFKLIYDCSDDNIGIKDDFVRKIVIDNEVLLLKNADYVFVSSERLKEVVLNRGYKGQPLIILNALDDNFLDLCSNKVEPCIMQEKREFKILYLGTISYWFDFDTVIKLLSECDDILIDLYGPVEVALSKHPRLNYRGIIEHNEICSVGSEYDLLIMPFVVNDLIKAVSPVKIYEYLSLGKNILSVRYEGVVNEFKDFIFTYSSYEEMKSIVMKLKNENKLKYDMKTVKEFLLKNTWSVRAKEIVQYLNEKHF